MSTLSSLKKLSREQSESLAGQILSILEPAARDAGDAPDSLPAPAGAELPRELVRTLTRLLLPKEQYPLALDPLRPGVPPDAGARLLQSLAVLSGVADRSQTAPAQTVQNPALLPSSADSPATGTSGPQNAALNPALRAAFAADPGSAFDNSAVAGQDAEGLSEYFRRDARRYDTGFTPFP